MRAPNQPIYELDTYTGDEDPHSVALITIKQQQAYIDKLLDHIKIYEKNLKNKLPETSEK